MNEIYLIQEKIDNLNNERHEIENEIEFYKKHKILAIIFKFNKNKQESKIKLILKQIEHLYNNMQSVYFLEKEKK